MNRLIFIFFAVINLSLLSQTKYEDYFFDKVLRIDYIHSGNLTDEEFVIKELSEEPFWGGSKTKLIDNFNYGKYLVQVVDKKSKSVIYSRNYSTLFSEWQTTGEAKVIKKAFEETVTIPFPKQPVTVKIFARTRKHDLKIKFEYNFEPGNYFVRKDKSRFFPYTKIAGERDPAKSVDIAILAEGYTKEQITQFRDDCKRFSEYLFNSTPYKENRNKFNIYAIESVSEEAGADIPAENIWKNTALNSSYYSLNLERYLMTESYWKVRDAAAAVPYDQIYILVNSDKYGGGSIFNYYNVCINKNRFEEYVFVHEFGHGFSFLADEYYDSQTTYEDFYDINTEPLEPNLTTLVDFNKKWKALVKESTPIPTPSEEQYKGKVGAFEGGGYVAKNIFRPRIDCSMNSISVDNYCPVCVDAIRLMIDFYTE